MAVKYVGGAVLGGERYLVGVPARDLSDEEMAELGVTAEELAASGVYAPYSEVPRRPHSRPLPEGEGTAVGPQIESQDAERKDGD